MDLRIMYQYLFINCKKYIILMSDVKVLENCMQGIWKCLYYCLNFSVYLKL